MLLGSLLLLLAAVRLICPTNWQEHWANRLNLNAIKSVRIVPMEGPAARCHWLDTAIPVAFTTHWQQTGARVYLEHCNYDPVVAAQRMFRYRHVVYCDELRIFLCSDSDVVVAKQGQAALTVTRILSQHTVADDPEDIRSGIYLYLSHEVLDDLHLRASGLVDSKCLFVCDDIAIGVGRILHHDAAAPVAVFGLFLSPDHTDILVEALRAMLVREQR